MIRNLKYIIPLVLSFAALVFYNYFKPKPLDWTPTYAREDKIPYGNFVLYSQLNKLFPSNKIIPVEKTIYETLDSTANNTTNYVFINPYFWASKTDISALFNYVKKGNSAFISSDNFGRTLADTLKLETDVKFIQKDSVATTISYKDSVKLHYTSPSFKNQVYDVWNASFYFSSFDTGKTVVLAVNEDTNATFIKVNHGKGAFYLCSTPKAFTNYNMLSGNNDEFVSRAFSFLPERDVYWDEYYQKDEAEKPSTPLRFILSNAALKWAYFITMLSLLLFIFFEAKRTQRIIPIIEPLSNTSLEFVDTIGKLYLYHSNDKEIALKKIRYFLEYIRSRFNLPTSELNERFAQALSEKSGVELVQVKELTSTFNYVAAQREISQEALIRLNKLIQNFYRNSK